MKVPSMNPVAGVGAAVMIVESRGDLGARKLGNSRSARKGGERGEDVLFVTEISHARQDGS